MKIGLFLATWALLLGASPGTCDTPAKQITFHILLQEGNPKGSVEAGTVKILAQPTVLALEKQSFTLVVGGEIPVRSPEGVSFLPFGLRIQGKAWDLKDGKVQVDLVLENSTQPLKTKDRTDIRTQSLHTVSTLTLGKSTRFFLGRNPQGKRIWADITAEESKESLSRQMPPDGSR